MWIKGTTISISGALVLFGLAACGSVTGTPTDGGGSGDGDGSVVDGDFSLAVNPGTLSVPIASAGQVTLTVSRTGTVGPITLAAQNVPAGVTVEFATNPIPEGTNTSEVTLTVAGGTAPATAQIAFVATAGQLEKSATLAFSSTAITVAGKVVDAAGAGRPNLTVRIVGKAAATTAADGTFTFTDVIPPYDLYTVASTGLTGSSTAGAFYYDDLTTPTPTVRAPTTFNLILLPTVTPTTVSGFRTTTGNATDPVALAWSGPYPGAVTTSLSNQSGYSHTLPIPSTAANTTGRMMGFQFTTKASGAPDTFLAFGQSGQFTVTRGTNLPGVDIPMATVANTGTITGTITAPNGYPVPTKILAQQFGATTVRSLWTSSAAVAADATYPIVATAGKTLFFATSSTGSGATEARTSYVHPLTTGAIDVTATLPAPAGQTAPIPSATNVTTATEFAWTSPDTSVDELRVSAGSAQVFTIYTRANSITLPAISEVTLAPNTNYTWNVQGYGPYASIDEAVTTRPIDIVDGVGADDFEGAPRTFTNSTDRTFTSAQ